jgi:SAM-dependent methyltransferase
MADDDYSGTTSQDGYWRTPEADAVMQRGNPPAWAAMADVEGARITGAKIVDIGCNKGGFVRYLCDHYAVQTAYGFDPAPGAIKEAEALNGSRPAEYLVGDRPPSEWAGIDVAFSQEVVYLIDDLAEHADDIWGLLRPGGSYVAVTCVHTRSERMTSWHEANADALGLPPLRGVEDYMAPFVQRGFEAQLGWLPVRLVPIDPDHVQVAWNAFEFWTKTSDKMLFRFVKPADSH